VVDDVRLAAGGLHRGERFEPVRRDPQARGHRRPGQAGMPLRMLREPSFQRLQQRSVS